MSKFPIRIKELRESKNISRKKLAEDLFISVRLISYWEAGKRECSFDMLIKLADYFNESIDFILGKTDL